MRTVTAATIAVLALALTGCTNTPPAPEADATPNPAPPRVTVDWDAYPPETQRIIDDAESAADCDALQGMFDTADTAGFTDQMRYIDEAMTLAGCY